MKKSITSVLATLIFITLGYSYEAMGSQLRPGQTSPGWTSKHTKFLSKLSKLEELRKNDISSTLFQINGSIDKIEKKFNRLIKRAQKIKDLGGDLEATKWPHTTLHSEINLYNELEKSYPKKWKKLQTILANGSVSNQTKNNPH